MTMITIGGGGEVTLPDDVRERYGLKPEVSVRLIETRSGLLLVPLTDAPMSAELAQELQEWQALGAAPWGQFPYEDGEREREVGAGMPACGQMRVTPRFRKGEHKVRPYDI